MKLLLCVQHDSRDLDQIRGGEKMKKDREADRSDGTGWTEHSDGEMAEPGELNVFIIQT